MLEQDAEDIKNGPIDIQEFGTNLSGITIPMDIALLDLIRKQVNSKSHPLNIISQHFTKVLIGNLEQKRPLIDLLLANLETPLEQLLDGKRDAPTN